MDFKLASTEFFAYAGMLGVIWVVFMLVSCTYKYRETRVAEQVVPDPAADGSSKTMSAPRAVEVVGVSLSDSAV